MTAKREISLRGKRSWSLWRDEEKMQRRGNKHATRRGGSWKKWGKRRQAGEVGLGGGDFGFCLANKENAPRILITCEKWRLACWENNWNKLLASGNSLLFSSLLLCSVLFSFLLFCSVQFSSVLFGSLLSSFSHIFISFLLFSSFLSLSPIKKNIFNLLQ